MNSLIKKVASVLWIILAVVGGFFGLPLIAAEWKQPTPVFWVAVLGGAFAIRTLFRELKKWGMMGDKANDQGVRMSSTAVDSNRVAVSSGAGRAFREL